MATSHEEVTGSGRCLRMERIHCFAMSRREPHQRGLAGTSFAIDLIASVTMSQPLDKLHGLLVDLVSSNSHSKVRWCASATTSYLSLMARKYRQASIFLRTSEKPA